MSAGWKVFWLSASLFAAALAAERLLAPGIGPIAFGLRAIELIAAWIAIMSLSIMTGAWVKERLRRLRDAPPCSPPASSAD
jgi:hypothetical protein